MEPLNNEEKDIIELLCTDEISLENFLCESNNPRFLSFLNGKNDCNLNVFKNGFSPIASQWKEHSRFWLPVIYLEKIANRLHKETNINNHVREEYTYYVQQALRYVINGYVKENKEDIAAVQMILHIIQVQDLTFIDSEIFNFIIRNLKNEKSSVVICNITPIIKKMLLQSINIDGIKQCIELMIELLPNEYTSSDYRSSYIKKFLFEPEIISKLADICDDAFLLKLADILTQTLNQDKEVSIKDEIKIKIEQDCSLKISIPRTPIEFMLPYCEFKDKENIAGPIIKKELEKYDGPDEYLYKKILYWYTYVWSDLTYITYPSLYDKPKGYYLYRQGVLIYLLKEILLIKLKKQGLKEFKNIYQTITSKNKYFIFKRILLYCYGKEFDKTRDILFALVNEEKYLLFSLYFEAEIYNLLQENVSVFNSKEKEKIEGIIECGPYNERVWDERKLNDAERYNIKQNWQQAWYSPLSKVEPFKQKYENLKEQTHSKEFFNFQNGVELQAVYYKSCLTDIEAINLLKNDPDKYVKKITEFSKKHPNRVEATMHEKPHPEGVADQLQRIASSYPAIITEVITKLSDLKPIYIRHILYGLRDTKDRKNIKWDKLSPFIENYIDQLNKEERSAQNTKKDTDDIWDVPNGKDIDFIIGSWSDIIFAQEDSDIFNISEIKRLLLKYLKLLLNNYYFDDKSISYIQDGKKYPVDYLTLSINTPVGRVLEKLIRIVISEKDWNLSVLQDIYDEMLEKKVAEAYVFLGLYFIFFYKSMKEWTEVQTSSFLTLSNDQDVKYWEMFFEGFIRSNNQYLDYYTWMFEHYKKAIELYNGRGQERLIDILVQFFEYDKDDLNSNSLIRFCWESQNFRILSGCVREISFPLNPGKIYDYNPNEKDKEEEAKVAPKAKKLWDFLWDQISLKHISVITSSPEQKELFANMLGLTPALQSLDKPTTGMISQFIDCIDFSSWKTSNLLSNLIYLVEKNNCKEDEIKNLADIYYKIIQQINYFTFAERHFKIIELLKKHVNNSKIKEKLRLIKFTYVNKKWNEYLDWF